MMVISVEDYEKALRGIPINDLQYNILNIIYWSSNHSSTAKIIANLLGKESYAPINLQYGKLGHEIAQFLRIEDQIPLSTLRGRPEWWYVLSKGEDSNQGFVWTLWPNLVIALENVNLIDEFKQAEKIILYSPIYEGKVSSSIVNRYERDPLARRLCIENYGPCCNVCDLDLSEIYGEIGLGYIHVHHLTPLANIKENHEIDPVKDLRPVCPNCHAMLHRKEPPYTIEELMEILQQQRNKLS